jgi:hypothetical protein
MNNEVERVFITYKERFARLSFDLMVKLFYNFGTEIVVINNRRFLNRFFSLPLDSQERLYKRKYCNYYLEDDFNKQPLSKMTKDLFMQIREDED